MRGADDLTLRRAAATGLLLLLALPCALSAQSSDTALAARLRAHVTAAQPRILAEFIELLSIPNLASDSVGIRANAARLVAMLERRGVVARTLESPGGGAPAVYGELRSPGAARTVMLYAHYDGQAVRPADWATPPWTPTLRRAPGRLSDPAIDRPQAGDTIPAEARLYARSASDDKAPIMAMMAALDALRALDVAPAANLRFFFEGEEEAGSPHLEALLRAHAPLLAADTWLFCDGPVHATGRPQVSLGFRGVLDLELTLQGPSRALHSGHYGNWAPNPLVELSHLIAAMRDREGRVTIPGFYQDVVPPSQAELAAVRAAPNTDDSVRRSLGLHRTEGKGARLGERVLLPALNVRSISGGTPGVNAIPTEATASIDIRLVPRQRPARVKQSVETFLKAQGYVVTPADSAAPPGMERTRIARISWGEGYAAVRTPADAPAARQLRNILREATGNDPVVVPSSGGSLPLDVFQRALGVVPINLPIVNPDNNQHAANENLRLRNLWDGVVIYGVLIARFN
ncbi:MAG TPA: M20/M25/M40 family metallo-hydrolase [Gemmatimonadales bacterium]|nr:M20/M25/M40 family metallo-hydrolase [Gemmatimonadales bacterium]